VHLDLLRQLKRFCIVIMLLKKTKKRKTQEMCKYQKLKESVVEGPELESVVYANPLKTRKVNIGTQDKPKFVNIGDYWSEETIENIVDLLHEYQDLFPTTFSEMKGIVGELGEMKIPLKPEAKPVRQRPYRLNPVYKKKVKEEIDRMLEAGIIEPLKNQNGSVPW
jgi:hypothetical protein